MTEFNQPPAPVGTGQINRARGGNVPFNPIRYKEWDGKQYQTSFVAAMFKSDNPNVSFQGSHTLGLEGEDYSFPRECIFYLQHLGSGEYQLTLGPTPIAQMKTSKMKSGADYLWGKVRDRMDVRGIRLERGCKFTCFPPHPNSKAHANGAAWTLRIDGLPRVPETLGEHYLPSNQGFAPQEGPPPVAQQAAQQAAVQQAYAAAGAVGAALGGGAPAPSQGIPAPDHQAPPSMFEDDTAPPPPVQQPAESPPF